MQVTCPTCRYRTEREVIEGEEISCPWCEGRYKPLLAPAEALQPPVAASSVLSEWAAQALPLPPKRKWTFSAIFSTAFVLFVLGVILIMPARSRWQEAQDKANSPPGLILTAQGQVLKVVFSPDGQRLVSGGGLYRPRKWVSGEIVVWDPSTGQSVLTFPGDAERVVDIDLSPDGKRLASAGPDGVKVWDTSTGQQLFRLRMPAHQEPWHVAFDPQGRRLATLSLTGRMAHGRGPMAIELWHTPPTVAEDRKAPLLSLPFEAGSSDKSGWKLPRLTFSPDGKHLACGQDNSVMIWEVSADGQGDAVPVRKIEGHSGPVRDQVFSPDGKRLATASEDETIRIWDTATGQEQLCFDSPREGFRGYRAIQCLAFSPDGRRLAGGKAQKLAIWDATTGKELYFLAWHTGTITSLAFSPDGKTLATGSTDQHIKLWNLAALEHRTPAAQKQE
ncbi:MAG TPA: WD40 repeat domain-containing protein [Gemmataceae bacterium]|jgi:WD40 repeat protein|nr:WD40 repeat domain-containing protein [Gemmataceae bacterium]